MADNLVLAAQQCFDRFSPAEESPQSFFGVLIDQVHTVVRLAAVAAASTPRSSFAAVLVQPDRIDWCQVGSTRIYRFRDAELLHCASDPLAYGGQRANDATETVPPTLRQGAQLPINHLGSRQPPVPALGSVDAPCSGDSILLCSDGVWSSLDSEVLTETVALGTCSEATEGLLRAASQQANDASRACSLVLIGLGQEA
jgi:serine/threonine protein phosphatase PrpC